MRIAIDTGGTFTDCIYDTRGSWACSKSFDAAESCRGYCERYRGLPASGRIWSAPTGTTVGTITLLERSVPALLLLHRPDFEDTLQIGRQARPRLFDWFASPEPPLAPSERRFEC